MVWVYDRTGSLLVAMLMHASLVAFWLASIPHAIAGAPLVTWYLVWAVALWVVVAAVALAQGDISRDIHSGGGWLEKGVAHKESPVTGDPEQERR